MKTQPKKIENSSNENPRKSAMPKNRKTAAKSGVSRFFLQKIILHSRANRDIMKQSLRQCEKLEQKY